MQTYFYKNKSFDYSKRILKGLFTSQTFVKLKFRLGIEF